VFRQTALDLIAATPIRPSRMDIGTEEAHTHAKSTSRIAKQPIAAEERGRKRDPPRGPDANPKHLEDHESESTS